MAETRPPFKNIRRRSLAFVFTFGLSIGFVFLLTVYASRASSTRAAEAEVTAPLAPQDVYLEIRKEGPGEAFAGDVVTYTLKITNHSESWIDNALITDTWVAAEPDSSPDGAEFNGNYWTSPADFVSDFTYGQPTGGPARWELNELEPGFQGSIHFTMAVPTELQPLHAFFYLNSVGPSTLGNSAAITDTDDAITVNDPDQVVTAIQGPVFKLQKSYTTEPGVGPRPGRLITYALRLENLTRSDSVPATNIVIEELMSDKLIFEDAWGDAGPGVDFDAASRHITWTLPTGFSLPRGAATTVYFAARLSTTQEWNRTIANDKDECWVISEELVTPVECWERVAFDTRGVVDITYVTEPSNLAAPDESYQNRYITYTVYVFNPLSQTIASNLRITDVMPSTWDYIRMINGIPPVWPAGDPTNTMVWHWSGAAIEPNGVISFTYLAHIGADTPIYQTSCRKTYYHTVTVSANEFPMVYHYPPPPTVYQYGLGKIVIKEQIKTEKSVTPKSQVAGEVVTYTAELENVTDRLVSNIIFTDTLPEYFRYDSMVSDLQPMNTPTRTIVWDVGDLGPGEKYELVFKVTVDGYWGTQYYNTTDGYSPEASFCLRDLEWTARVKVLSPIVYSKDADPPLDSGAWVVQGEWFEYSVEYQNQSKFFDHTIDGFADQLPDGFEVDGSNPYVTSDHGLPFVLLKNLASSWSHSFQVDTPGQGSGTDWCNDLRYDEDGYNPNHRREIYQEKETFDVHAFEVDVWATNAKKEAPILFKPHVDLRQVVHPKKVDLGGTVEVTLTLHNNMRNHNGATPRAVNGIAVTYTPPMEFTFLDSVPPAPTQQPDGKLVWTGLDLPAGEGQERHLRFRLKAPFEEKLVPLKGNAQANPTLDPDICIPRSEANHYVVKGVEISKKPSTATPPPLSIIEYDLELENETTAAVDNLSVTDILPAGFTFIEVVDGPPLATTNPLAWQNLHLEPAGDRERRDKINIRFKVQVSGLFGEYYNLVEGLSSSTYVTYANNYTENVKVIVQPGVVLYKSVWPEEAKSGETVVYTVTADNRWTKAIADVRVVDTLPSGFSYRAPKPGYSAPAVQPDGRLVWTVDELEVEEKVEFAFLADIDDQISGGNYCNQLSATAHEKGAAWAVVSIPDTGPTACLPVQAAFDLQVSKSDGRVTVDEGELLEYTITYTNDNAADVTLTGVVITESFSPLPPYAVPTGLGSAWHQVAGTDVYTHLVGDLGPGGSGSVQFSLQLAGSIPQEVKVVSNIIEIGHEPNEAAVEADPSNNRFTDFGILRGSDLVVTGIDIFPEELMVGEPITVIVTVRNQGKDATVNSDGEGMFIGELYLKGSDFAPPGPPVDVDDHLGGWIAGTGAVQKRDEYSCPVFDSIAGGGEAFCAFEVTVEDPDLYDVYIQADVNPPDYDEEPWGHDYGAIEEAIETNNVYSYGWVRISNYEIYLPLLNKRR